MLDVNILWKFPWQCYYSKSDEQFFWLLHGLLQPQKTMTSLFSSLWALLSSHLLILLRCLCGSLHTLQVHTHPLSYYLHLHLMTNLCMDGPLLISTLANHPGICSGSPVISYFSNPSLSTLYQTTIFDSLWSVNLPSQQIEIPANF